MRFYPFLAFLCLAISVLVARPIAAQQMAAAQPVYPAQTPQSMVAAQQFYGGPGLQPLPSYQGQVQVQQGWQQQRVVAQNGAPPVTYYPFSQQGAPVPSPQQQVMQQGAMRQAYGVQAPRGYYYVQAPYASPPRAVRPPMPVARPAGVEKPLYEIGVGLVMGFSPAYPASDENMFHIFPFPSFIYRGDVLRADREGARAVIAENDMFEFGISASASLPATSDDIDARKGMPDLDFLFEIGPALRTTLYRDADEQVRFDVPLRPVIGIGGEDGIGYRGLIFHPEFKYRISHFLETDANALFALGPIFSLDGMGNYFYGVDAKYATASRPTYKADEGYMGTELSAFFSLPLDERIRMFTAPKLLINAGAANDKSPLFREDFNTSILLGLSYSFYHSDEKVLTAE